MNADGTLLTLLAALCLALGLIGVFRAVFLAARGERGHFRFDTWISLGLGCALIFIGQYLLRL